MEIREYVKNNFKDLEVSTIDNQMTIKKSQSSKTDPRDKQ